MITTRHVHVLLKAHPQAGTDRSSLLPSAQCSSMTNSAHASTSESVKTRPRTKPGANAKGGSKRMADSKQSDVVKLVENNPRKKSKTELQPKKVVQPMTLAHYDELSVIWTADRRIPSAASRRAWALARNLRPDIVNRWWYRRKLVAKKANITIPRDTYELAVGTPPTLCTVVKKEGEEDADHVEERRAGRLTKLRMEQHSANDYDLERPSSPSSEATEATSSTTVFDSILSTSDSTANTALSSIYSSESAAPHGKRAYTQSPNSPGRFSSPISESASLLSTNIRYYTSSPLPPSSPPLPASTPISETSDFSPPGPGLEIPSCGLILDYMLDPQLDEPIALQCNQGSDDISTFTCSLCIQAHISPGIDSFLRRVLFSRLFSRVVSCFLSCWISCPLI